MSCLGAPARSTRITSTRSKRISGLTCKRCSSPTSVGVREMADKTGEPLPRLRGSLKRLVDEEKSRVAGYTAAHRSRAK